MREATPSFTETETSPANTRSSMDADREEMKWGEPQERQISVWQTECLQASKAHKKASRLNKQLYYATALPVALLPLIGSAVQTMVQTPCGKPPILAVCTGLLSTAIAGISTVFKFGHKDQLHAEFENRYHELYVNIQKEMSKPKRFRMACDVYLESVSSEMNRLGACAPPL